MSEQVSITLLRQRRDGIRQWLAEAGEDARRGYDPEDAEAHWGWEWRRFEP